jgi:hypothetical protein
LGNGNLNYVTSDNITNTIRYAGGGTLSSSSTLPITITGLNSIGLSSFGNGILAATFTLLTPSTNGATYIPANSVVIPTDAKGNIQIILQSSSDLVNWVPSLPGTYGNTYSNRFFRVIAVAQ